MKFTINDNEVNRLRIETGSRFRQFRINTNQTQKEVAESIGKSNSWLSSVENGEHNLLIHDLILLCEYYGVSSSYFLDSESNVFSNNTTTGEIDPIELSELFHRKLSTILPVRVPIYLQSDFTFDSYGEPVDYFYWSRQKIQSREVFCVQAQTNNLCKSKISPIAKNDRVVVQQNTPLRTGIGVLYSFKRKNFKETNGLGIAEFTQDKSGNWYYWNQAMEKPLPLDPTQYIGMVIQSIKTYPFQSHNPMWMDYSHLQEDIPPGSIKDKDTTIWKPKLANTRLRK